MLNIKSFKNYGKMSMINKEELAKMAGYSRAWFWREIHGCKVLMQQLTAAGYKKSQKQLSDKQTEIIKRHYCID